ncbi:MAG: inositol monophosphatase family protein [Nitrososphaeria archaeon]
MSIEEFSKTLISALEHARNKIINSREEIVSLGENRFGDTTYNIDYEAEKAILEDFKKSGIGFTLISEESGKIDVNGGGLIAVVDPLDGSNNAVRGIPCYSVSICISKSYKFSDIILSGVINVVTGDIIFCDGKNVYLNGQVKKPSSRTELPITLATVIPRVYGIEDSRYGEKLLKILKHVKYPRFFGTAAIETAYVSTGNLDAFIELYPRLRVVDIASSLHMAKTSGAFFKLLNIENELDLSYNGRISCILAANEALGNKILDLIS